MPLKHDASFSCRPPHRDANETSLASSLPVRFSLSPARSARNHKHTFVPFYPTVHRPADKTGFDFSSPFSALSPTPLLCTGQKKFRKEDIFLWIVQQCGATSLFLDNADSLDDFEKKNKKEECLCFVRSVSGPSLRKLLSFNDFKLPLTLLLICES